VVGAGQMTAGRPVRRGSLNSAATVALVAVICALAALAAAAPALAAPKTLHGAAYSLMDGFMTRWDKDGFAKVVDLGGAKAYRVRLAQCRIRVDPGLRSSDGSTPNAVYGPDPNVITFSRDPRTLPASARDAWGETVWHEVTHALEESHGDDMTNGDKLYQDRNTWYMRSVAVEALPFLDAMEKKAKAGAPVADIAKLWKSYLAKMEYASSRLPETAKYPPDLALMQKWFGFRADPEQVKKLYLSGKALPGRAGALLRQALTPALAAADWGGVWDSTAPNAGALTLAVSGLHVTGTFEFPYWKRDLQGTLSADGMTLTGTWKTPTNLVSGPEWYIYDFSLTLGINDIGTVYFDGHFWADSKPDQKTDWTGYRR
jgi:hypothetical protein